MRTDHFSPGKKQTVGENKNSDPDTRIESVVSHICALAARNYPNYFDFVYEGLCNAIGFRCYSAACGRGIEFPNSPRMCLVFSSAITSIGKIKSAPNGVEVRFFFFPR